MVTRAATAKEVDGLIDEWQEAARLFDLGAKAVEEVSRKTAPTNGTAAFSMNARMELPAAITTHPTAEWVARQITEAFP
jgi:hypothetical protein